MLIAESVIYCAEKEDEIIGRVYSRILAGFKANRFRKVWYSCMRGRRGDCESLVVDRGLRVGMGDESNI